jgi:HprK-related kinase A
MKLSQLSSEDLAHRLRTSGLSLSLPPLVVRLRSRLEELVPAMSCLYGDYDVIDEPGFADFHVSLDATSPWRRHFRPKVVFRFDDQTPFEPLPASHALALFEWGLNWCVTNHCLQHLIVHAAVVAKDGAALVLPGTPGSGKSTLCAALVHRGWRLLSDELALFETGTGLLTPFPRPVSLKNASIDLIRSFAPHAVIGPVTRDTQKGAVAHMRAPGDSVARAAEPAAPRWIVFPRYQASSATCLQPLSPARVFMGLAGNSFNHHLHGAHGFDCFAAVADRCPGYELAYPDLDRALDELARLMTKP